jgi:colanic acid biosynthesis glycosyl transferase WcaI
VRLLFLNRSFWPDIEATGQFLTELCEDLSLEHEVTFISGPSYHVATARSLWTRETFGRVSIIRTWGTRLPKARLALRMTNLGTYFVLAAVAALRLEPPDIIIAETDPPMLGALGAMLKRRWGCRFVYNVRDLYPDIAIANGGVKNRFLLRLLGYANGLAYELADKVAVLGEDMRQRIAAKGVASERIAVMPDWVDCEQIRPLAGNPFRSEFGDKFVVMYSGNLGLSQQLETVIGAADRLRNDSQILFVFIGEGARKKWLVDRAAQLELPNVMFMPYRPKERLAESLGAADLHLIPLAPGTGGCVVPSKVYGILAAGRPFVAIMEDSAEIARLATEHRVGFVSAPGNDAVLADTVLDALRAPAELKQMGQCARMLAVERFERKVATRRFAQMLDEVAHAHN